MPTDYVTRRARFARHTARATAPPRARPRRHVGDIFIHRARARRVRIRRATTRATVDRARGTPTVVDRARGGERRRDDDRIGRGRAAGSRERGVTFPLACPVSLRALRADGVEASSGLRYEENEGRWDLTVGAATNARGEDAASAPPGSLVDLARSALPKELRGLLPTSGYFGTATFETPQVAFAHERGWRDSFKRAGFRDRMRRRDWRWTRWVTRREVG